MKFKPQMPREGGNLAAQQRGAVCCPKQSKISQSANKGASLSPCEGLRARAALLRGPWAPCKGGRGRFGPAQTGPRRPPGALQITFSLLLLRWAVAISCGIKWKKERSRRTEHPPRWVTNTGCKWVFFCAAVTQSEGNLLLKTDWGVGKKR